MSRLDHDMATIASALAHVTPLRRLRSGFGAEGAIEFAVVLGVVAIGVGAMIVLMHSAGPGGISAILRGIHP